MLKHSISGFLVCLYFILLFWIVSDSCCKETRTDQHLDASSPRRPGDTDESAVAMAAGSPVGELMSCRTRGRRVTMPEPRGRKSLWRNTHKVSKEQKTPTHFSPNRPAVLRVYKKISPWFFRASLLLSHSWLLERIVRSRSHVFVLCIV